MITQVVNILSVWNTISETKVVNVFLCSQNISVFSIEMKLGVILSDISNGNFATALNRILTHTRTPVRKLAKNDFEDIFKEF
jgi:hypothetical protein